TRADLPLIVNAHVPGSPMRSVTSEAASIVFRSPRLNIAANSRFRLTVACIQHGPVGAIARCNPSAGDVPVVPTGVSRDAGAAVRPAAMTSGDAGVGSEERVR